jgi:hypothetical protein
VAVQKTESTSESSTLAKTTEKSRLKNVQMDEKALELKLEASTRKLHQRYQQAQNAKRKIELIDFKDIPKPENAPKRSSNQYRRLYIILRISYLAIFYHLGFCTKIE